MHARLQPRGGRVTALASAALRKRFGHRRRQEPLLPAWIRRGHGLWRLCRPHPLAVESDAVVSARLRRRSEVLAMSTEPGEVATTLWDMESLVCSAVLTRPPGWRLSSLALPLAARPIAHSGLGLGLALRHGDDETALLRAIDEGTEKACRRYVHESVGAVQAAREGLFGQLASWSGQIGTSLPVTRRHHPSWLRSWPSAPRALAAHGYGRMLFFKSTSASRAIRAAHRLQAVHGDDLGAPVARGVGVAFAMIHAEGLGRLLAFRPPGRWRGAFRLGLLDALMYLSWVAPRSVRRWLEIGPEGRLVTIAVRRATRARTQGLPPPLIVS